MPLNLSAIPRETGPIALAPRDLNLNSEFACWAWPGLRPHLGQQCWMRPAGQPPCPCLSLSAYGPGTWEWVSRQQSQGQWWEPPPLRHQQHRVAHTVLVSERLARNDQSSWGWAESATPFPEGLLPSHVFPLSGHMYTQIQRHTDTDTLDPTPKQPALQVSNTIHMPTRHRSM